MSLYQLGYEGKHDMCSERALHSLLCEKRVVVPLEHGQHSRDSRNRTCDGSSQNFCYTISLHPENAQVWARQDSNLHARGGGFTGPCSLRQAARPNGSIASRYSRFPWLSPSLSPQNWGGWRELNSRILIHNQSPEPLGYTRHSLSRTWRRRDLNSQPSACKADALPLRHIPR